jgi:hypothetical protein
MMLLHFSSPSSVLFMFVFYIGFDQLVFKCLVVNFDFQCCDPMIARGIIYITSMSCVNYEEWFLVKVFKYEFMFYSRRLVWKYLWKGLVILACVLGIKNVLTPPHYNHEHLYCLLRSRVCACPMVRGYLNDYTFYVGVNL